MMPTSNSTADLYHYTENGQTKGPVTAQQLKELAQAGRIQAHTYVWKEGFPDWVPASSLQGLLPQNPGIVPPSRVVSRPQQQRPATILEMGVARPPQSGGKLLAGLIIGGVLLFAGIVTGVILLIAHLSSGEKKSKSDPKDVIVKNGDKAKKDETPTPKPEPPKKKEPPPPPVTFAANDLLVKYRTDPDSILKGLKGKPLTLTLEGTWQVENLKDSIKDGKLSLWYRSNVRNINSIQPHEAIQLIFPLSDEKAKLGFFAKIEGYAKKLTKGEKVVMSITGVLTTTPIRNLTYLSLTEAVMN